MAGAVIWAVRATFGVAIVALLVLAFVTSVRPPAEPARPTASSGGQATQAPSVTPLAAPGAVARTPVPLPTATFQAIVSRMARTTPTVPPQQVTSLGEPLAVTISDAGFAPAEIRIKTGVTVTWRNVGLQSHDVSIVGQDGATWGSGLLAPNGGTTRTFGGPGQYDYTCSLHTTMRGRIVVEP